VIQRLNHLAITEIRLIPDEKRTPVRETKEEGGRRKAGGRERERRREGKRGRGRERRREEALSLTSGRPGPESQCERQSDRLG
jgi:hypothetical protein